MYNPQNEEEDEDYDICCFQDKKEIKELIGNETFRFSAPITKQNRFGFKQERNIVITSSSIYSLKDKNLQRKIEINKLRGITTSQQSEEFVFHGNEEEYDYLYLSPYKNKIIQIIEEAFERLTGRELLFANLNVPHLKNFVTSKAEKKKNPKFSRMDDSMLSDIKEYLKIECTELNRKNSDDLDDNLMEEFDLPEGKQSIIARGSTIWEKTSQGEDFMEPEDDEIIKLIQCNIEDLEFLKLIGEGKYLKTYIARHKAKDQIYAVRVGEKHTLMNNDFVDNFHIEKKISGGKRFASSCKFIPKLMFCFQTGERVFLGHNFFNGGDLYNYVLKRGGVLPEEEVKLIAEQLIQALEELHNQDIIYRNLKLENILFDDKGYIKLVDFTKSYMIWSDDVLGFSFYGTDEYMPPEIIEGNGQSKSVDWWMLGIVLFELLYGKTPFHSDYIERTLELIIFSQVLFPQDREVSKEMKDFISDLLKKSPSYRLGDCSGVEELKEHPLFKNSTEFSIKPIFQPELKGEDDVSYFDEEFTKKEVNIDSYISGYDLNTIKVGNNQGMFKWAN